MLLVSPVRYLRAFCLVVSASLFANLAVAENVSPSETVAERVYSGKVLAMKVEPTALTLSNRLDAKRILVSGKTPDGLWLDFSRRTTATISPDAAKIVGRDADGFFFPKSDGKAVVRIAAAGFAIDLPITVQGFGADRPISYVRDVMPVLGKAGCNSGSCHGGQKGKAGFKLSLRGYDPEWDHEQLVDDLSSRRFNRSRPQDSLMLLKPVGEVPHEGGQRFGAESNYYRILLQWINEGNSSDVGKVKRAEKLTVLPKSPTIPEPGMSQDLLVLAHYSDGSTRDVTRDSEFLSSRDIVAKVSPQGRITAIRRGETSIVVRYEGNYQCVDNVSVLGDRPGYQWVERPAYNYIDGLVYEKLKKIKALPSDVCTDGEFLRRVYIDLIGAPPSVEELKAFLTDRTPEEEKRAKAVDSLLGRPEYVDRWAHKWADLLQCNRKYLGERGAWAFRSWLRLVVAGNMPIDQFVRKLLTASGDSSQNPAVNYFRVARDPQAATESTTQLFLGTRFNCNKCHDHPFERWTQVDYYRFGAFFSEVGRKPGLQADEEIVYDRRDGGEQVLHPRTKQVMLATFPFEHAGAASTSKQQRRKLADWLTSPDNPYFAKSIVNRYWSYFLGVGIVDPVDDIRSSNPPSNPELLDALVKDFVAHRFDMKHLMRTICTSRTYQLSLNTNRFNADDAINFSHALPRRLSAEQLADAIAAALDVPGRYNGLPAGLRATQLPDTKVEADFLDQFGRPPRESVCECERVAEVSLKQALNLINGPTVGDALGSGGNRIVRLATQNLDDAQLVEEIYLAVLCRRPDALESKKGAEYLKLSGKRLEAAQDLAWALLNSPAFLFNR